MRQHQAVHQDITPQVHDTAAACSACLLALCTLLCWIVLLLHCVPFLQAEVAGDQADSFAEPSCATGMHSPPASPHDSPSIDPSSTPLSTSACSSDGQPPQATAADSGDSLPAYGTSGPTPNQVGKQMMGLQSSAVHHERENMPCRLSSCLQGRCITVLRSELLVCVQALHVVVVLGCSAASCRKIMMLVLVPGARPVTSSIVLKACAPRSCAWLPVTAAMVSQR